MTGGRRPATSDAGGRRILEPTVVLDDTFVQNTDFTNVGLDWHPRFPRGVRLELRLGHERARRGHTMNPPTRHEVAVAFGSLLRTARDATELSQGQLAGGADLDRTYPSRRAFGVDPMLLVRSTVRHMTGNSSDELTLISKPTYEGERRAGPSCKLRCKGSQQL